MLQYESHCVSKMRKCMSLQVHMWVFLYVCVYNCSYSQCGLAWFQGVVSPIPPISGASLRDVLGSLMLSIVGGTKHLPVPNPPTLSPPSVFFLSFFLSLLTIFLHAHQLSCIWVSIGWWAVHFFLIVEDVDHSGMFFEVLKGMALHTHYVLLSFKKNKGHE